MLNCCQLDSYGLQRSINITHDKWLPWLWLGSINSSCQGLGEAFLIFHLYHLSDNYSYNKLLITFLQLVSDKDLDLFVDKPQFQTHLNIPKYCLDLWWCLKGIYSAVDYRWPLFWTLDYLYHVGSGLSQTTESITKLLVDYLCASPVHLQPCCWLNDMWMISWLISILFTKQTDVLPRNLVKSRSREIRV